MKVCVLGLWHQGVVIAAGLASLGHRVVGVDFDAARIAGLDRGVAPVFEPELEPLLRRGLAARNLRFSSSLADTTAESDVLWIAHDTPVDAEGRGDFEVVMDEIERVLTAGPLARAMLVSAQLPVGSIRRLERLLGRDPRRAPSMLAYSPENLRLGAAVRCFLHPERVVVGVREGAERGALEALLNSITACIEWMSVESAEMTKHAINAFFATSVAFANEIAAMCEQVGADAKEVERGLKSEGRIGRRAFLSPGAAFGGGTLSRDVIFLERIAREHGLKTPLLAAVLPSNRGHAGWVTDKLSALFSDLSTTTVAIWGLTYKPGTDTLRGSSAVRLCDWMLEQGMTVKVHDPMVEHLPDRWLGRVARYGDPIAALDGADALVLATEWPVYRSVGAEIFARRARLVILDPGRFLENLAGRDLRLNYFAVGMPLAVP
jgi:UDPglucose 6-dehydrogenase